jgi:hypothetical protein
MKHALTLITPALLLASCGQSAHKPQSIARPAATPKVAAPSRVADRPVASINRGLTPAETLWHLRAGLNVAAISCRGSRTVAPAYNRMLGQHRAALAIAASSEQARFGAGAANVKQNDRHQTQLYNFFAGPRGQAGLCRSAASVLARINAMNGAQLNQAAPRALAEVEAPFV